MLETLRELLDHQYEASLCALHFAIVRCPDAIWNAPVAKWTFCQAAFHVVFFADVYLHVYNIRHIQHHAAQLALRLRLEGEVDIPWVGHGWREVV